MTHVMIQLLILSMFICLLWAIIFLIKGKQKLRFYKSYWIIYSDFIFWLFTIYAGFIYLIIRWLSQKNIGYVSIIIFYIVLIFLLYLFSLYIITTYIKKFKGDNIFYTTIEIKKIHLYIFIYIPIFNLAVFSIIYLLKIIEKDKINEKFIN